ncbi:RNA-directed DNA polymerase, eukaryota [Tanacetum coccineum]
MLPSISRLLLYFATRGLGVKDVHHVRAIAVNVRASYPEMRKLFEDAAKLFSSIGKKGLADERQRIIEQCFLIIKMGRPPYIARREIECAELRLGKDGWPEYYDGKSGWDARKQQVGQSIDLKAKLCDIDKELDQGGVSDDILLSRMEIMKQLHDIQSSKHRDLIQKVKIRWAIEGDENSKCHFAERFLDPGPCRGNLDFLFPNRLNDEQVLEMEAPVSNDEIRTAYVGMWRWISPLGIRFGFHFRLLSLSSGLIVGQGFCIAVKWFFSNMGISSTGRNSSFVALIPKVLDPKVTLSAFLPNRQILDGPFIINEILARCKAKKQQAMIFKVDFAKAYDSIRWDFLDDVLASFGFGSKWRSWIRGIFKGLKIDSSLSLSHLFFADDAVFVGEWSQANLKGIMIFIRCFFFISGMSINILKSHLLGFGIPENCVVEAAKSIGCSTMRTPFRYLGILVGDNMSSKKAWDETIIKMRKRLSKWKINTLSIGGRLTLLKSVLGSTPIYDMAIFKVPKSILNTMESIRRRFFNELKKKIVNKIPSVGFRQRINDSITSSFRRFVRGGVESFQLDHLKVLLEPVILSNMEDRWYWDLNGDGVFRVKDARNLIDEFFIPKGDKAYSIG